LLRDGIVLAYDGQPLAMRAQSILVHGDTPGAVALARVIRREIEAAGGRVVPVSRLMV
jgi:5-oxoprolinase (ATP-hydrolysing) subunit A